MLSSNREILMQIVFSFWHQWRQVIVVTGVLVGGIMLVPSKASAFYTDRRCVCDIEGSGDCDYGEYFCCDFSGTSWTCGCVWVGFGGSCTNEE